jgi:hypothetical protein
MSDENPRFSDEQILLFIDSEIPCPDDAAVVDFARVYPQPT